jgi:hypothetical protein
MVNCAHPTHYDDVLSGHASWTNRVRGLRANASTKSHAELDVATELDAGNPQESGQQYREVTPYSRPAIDCGKFCWEQDSPVKKDSTRRLPDRSAFAKPCDR